MRARFLPFIVGMVVGSVLSGALPAFAQIVRDFALVERAPSAQELHRLAQDADELARRLAIVQDNHGRLGAYQLAKSMVPRLRRLAEQVRTAPSAVPVAPRRPPSADQAWDREFGQSARPVLAGPVTPDCQTPARGEGRAPGRCSGTRCAVPPVAMGPAEFSAWLSLFDRSMLSHEREALLRVAAHDQFFMAEQVAALMQRYAFDRERIDVALALWPHIVDPPHAYLLIEALTFTHSQNELARKLGVQARPMHF